MSASLKDLLAQARSTGDFTPLVRAVPFSQFLGFSIERDGAGVLGRLTFSPRLVGNSFIQALHGGSIGALLESTAIFGLIWETEPVQTPRIVNITVEYLRSAKTVDTFARAEITRQGRRVATVRVMAWQEDPDRPIAAANTHFLLTPSEPA